MLNRCATIPRVKLNLPIILSKKVSREPHAASVPRAKNSHQQSNFVHTNGVTSVKEAYPTAVEELRNFGERYIRKVHERIHVVTSDRTGPEIVSTSYVTVLSLYNVPK